MLTADARTLRLPTFRQRLGARLHKLLCIVEQMLAVLGHHLEPAATPSLERRHGLRH